MGSTSKDISQRQGNKPPLSKLSRQERITWSRKIFRPYRIPLLHYPAGESPLERGIYYWI
jgi:hypothetical protein